MRIAASGVAQRIGSVPLNQSDSRREVIVLDEHRFARYRSTVQCLSCRGCEVVSRPIRLSPSIVPARPDWGDSHSIDLIPVAPTRCPLFESSTLRLDGVRALWDTVDSISRLYSHCSVRRCASSLGAPYLDRPSPDSPPFFPFSPLLLFLVFNFAQFHDRDWSSKAFPARSSCRASHVSQWARYSHRRRSLSECPGRRGRLVSLALVPRGMLANLVSASPPFCALRNLALEADFLILTLAIIQPDLGFYYTIPRGMRSPSSIEAPAGCPRCAMLSTTTTRLRRFMASCTIGGGKSSCGTCPRVSHGSY